ncbi:hypothetical protein pdam_00006078 [Pocillopora damicornis]|uniref:Uncharacterized protein n=1 Tax=Pocillopora damicornis TaxID=46731 RepID=A0A3M6TT43_POCDA|nr:hypothetical protein pdam_00006078 [Pocillopora damicornis]
MSKITNFFTPGTSNGGKHSKVSSNSDNNKDEDEEPLAKRSLKSTSSEATERFASYKKSSVSSEDVYRIIKDKKLDERQKVNDSILFKVFYSIYWLAKEGIANKKAAGLLTLLEKLGVNDLKYFDHRSPASVREMFSTLSCAVKENVVT